MIESESLTRDAKSVAANFRKARQAIRERASKQGNNTTTAEKVDGNEPGMEADTAPVIPKSTTLLGKTESSEEMVAIGDLQSNDTALEERLKAQMEAKERILAARRAKLGERAQPSVGLKCATNLTSVRTQSVATAPAADPAPTKPTKAAAEAQEAPVPASRIINDLQSQQAAKEQVRRIRLRALANRKSASATAGPSQASGGAAPAPASTMRQGALGGDASLAATSNKTRVCNLAAAEATRIKPNAPFLARFVKGIKTTNRRVTDDHLSAAGNQAMAFGTSSAARPKLTTAAEKGLPQLRKTALNIAEEQRFAMCSALLQEVSLQFGYNVVVRIQEDVKPETEPNCEAVEAKKQDNESQPPKKTLEARLTETPEEKPAPKLLLSRYTSPKVHARSILTTSPATAAGSTRKTLMPAAKSASKSQVRQSPSAHEVTCPAKIKNIDIASSSLFSSALSAASRQGKKRLASSATNAPTQKAHKPTTITNTTARVKGGRGVASHSVVRPGPIAKMKKGISLGVAQGRVVKSGRDVKKRIVGGMKGGLFSAALSAAKINRK